jgi:uncharacterized coiled-coil DUF342 family protein
MINIHLRILIFLLSKLVNVFVSVIRTVLSYCQSTMINSSLNGKKAFGGSASNSCTTLTESSATGSSDSSSPLQRHNPSSMNSSDLSDKYNAASTAPTPTLVNPSKLECDYDANPTVLYQAIEAKQWDYAVSLFTKHKQGEQASTWVVRKETNGKLRWRLLPLHAAVIFGSPLKLIEQLLVDYPNAAQSKDDQGMLPLHLAFRNESSFEIIEELLTAFPQAVFVSDRKGRTPLQCGDRSLGSSTSVDSHYNQAESRTFKSVVSVLDLFSQIAVSGERQRLQEEARKVTEARIIQLQDSHLSTLTSLKREWYSQREESKDQLQDLQKEKRALEQKIKTQEIDLSVSRTTEKNLTDKLRQLTLALNHANEKTKNDEKNPKMEQCQRTNRLLRTMIEDLVSQQKSCHAQFNDLMTKYQKLVEERSQVQAAFLEQSTVQAEKEAAVVNNFKKWLNASERVVNQHEMSLQEEKKVEDVTDFVDRTTEKPTKMTPRPPKIQTSAVVENIIDLSNLGSP